MPSTPGRNFCILLFVSTFLHFGLQANRNHLGFGFDSEKESVTIPFTSYNNLIIITCVIDEKKHLNLILDTGIRSLVLFDKTYIPKVSDKTFNISFTGAGNHTPISAKVSINHNLRLCRDVVANQINAVILSQSNKFLHELNGIKIHGAFGYQLFSRFRVAIDYKNELITLSEPFKTDHINGFEAIPISIQDTKPFLEMNFLAKKHRWKKLNLILDLGANHKLLLHDQANLAIALTQTSQDQRIAEGLSGSIYGKKAFSKSIRLGSMFFAHTEVLIPTNSSYHTEKIERTAKHGSIGGKFFNKSIIVLDYINGFLFIENSDDYPPPVIELLAEKKLP